MPAAAPKTLAQALLKVQAEMPAIQKDAINDHFHNAYITLESLMPKVLPILQANGILLSQMMDQVDGKPALTTRLIHVATGEEIVGSCPLDLAKPGPQQIGSAVTYYRRYALLSALNLVADKDDDGNTAQTAAPAPAPAAVAAPSGDSPFGGSLSL